MDKIIYSPQKDYEEKIRDLHLATTTAFFDDLTARSGVNIAENRKTVAEYLSYKENLVKLKKKLFWWKFLRVIMCITIILIPLVIIKTTPHIRKLREEIEDADRKADALLAKAYDQMLPLNSLFTDRDALGLIEKAMPLVSFDGCFSAEKERDMQINYDFTGESDPEESTIDLLSGTYNGNPFLFENKLVHTMGTETYHGYKTISWTETYTDSNGKLQQRTRSETLHATVVKPKPFYRTRVVLNYGAQGAPDLTFSRDASHLERKSDKAIKRIVKAGNKKIRNLTEKAVRDNKNFTGMANGEFDALFNALNRSNEVQFRTLFTPLAQVNMLDIILSKEGYGDDFRFIKNRRMNKIVSDHSQGREMILKASEYTSYEYDVIRKNFIEKNQAFFKAVYFDFAPILAIPAYQERPVHSLKPIPDLTQKYSLKECEALANVLPTEAVAHPQSGTLAILKSEYIGSTDLGDRTCITAYSYAIARRTDFVSVHGGDGRYHRVPVDWDEYLPLEYQTAFSIAEKEKVTDAMGSRNGLCIY